MDAFEMLLHASGPFNGENLNSPMKNVPSFGQFQSSLLDPVDSIMMLADQAIKQSPVDNKTITIPSWGDYGPYFSNEVNARRLRAMSEPWTTQDALSVSLKYCHGENSAIDSFASAADPSDGTAFLLQQLEHDSLPNMLDKYSSIYNKNGRVGIYTREERNAIINRFHEKRKRRVWKKKIRYTCRKNLADRRVRVKGRFVKNSGGVKLSGGAHVNGDDLNHKVVVNDANNNGTERLMFKLKRPSAKNDTISLHKAGGTNSVSTPSSSSFVTTDSPNQSNTADGSEEDDEDEMMMSEEDQEEDEATPSTGSEDREDKSNKSSGTSIRIKSVNSIAQQAHSTKAFPTNVSSLSTLESSNSVIKNGGNACKLYFLSSMLNTNSSSGNTAVVGSGDNISTVRSSMKRVPSLTQSIPAVDSDMGHDLKTEGGADLVDGVDNDGDEEVAATTAWMGSRGKKMRRHSIAY